MKPPPPALVPLLTVAAELRAGGASWEQVGTEVHRAAESCRRWPREYAEVWSAAFRAAADRFQSDAGAEALLTLRTLLRSPDDRLRLLAARTLLLAQIEARRLELRAAELGGDPMSDPIFVEALRVTRLVKDMTDEQVVAELDRPIVLALPAGRGPEDLRPPG